MKKGLKITLIVVGAIVGILLLISILAGPIVRAYAEKHSVELCHRVATIKHVRINIFTGNVSIIGLVAKEENGKDEFLSFDKLKIQVALPSLLSKTLRINKINLDGLKAQVIQNGIDFNFSDIIDFYTKDKPEKSEKEPSTWVVDIRNIHVQDAAVLYKDLKMGSCFDTKDVDIKVPRLYLKEKATHLDLKTNFAEGGGFDLNGEYNIEKGDFSAAVNMHELPLTLGEPYLKNLANFDQLIGILKGNANIKGCVKHINDMVFFGKMALDKVKITNADKTPLSSFGALSMDIEKGDLGRKDFKINNISLKDWELYVDIYKDGTTIGRLLNKNEKSDTTQTKEISNDTIAAESVKPSSIQYLVKNVAITNGKIIYTDHSVSPKEQVFPISNINLKADVLTNGQQSPVTLTANLGTSGKLTCNAHVDLLNFETADANISIQNLDIRDFNPYSLYYLAYPVEDGLLSFASNIDINHNWLDSQNALDIYKPTFGKKDKNITPAAVKLPMKAAMYIVTDRKGHVNMELPVKGDISSPEFSFRKVIWKTFTNLLVKIAASPIDLIAKAVGDNTFKAMELPTLENMQLSNENCYQLNEIVKTLKEKDQMTLVLNAAANPTPYEGEDANSIQNRSVALTNKSISLITNYIKNQGISSERITIDAENKAKPTIGKVKITFNLKMIE